MSKQFLYALSPQGSRAEDPSPEAGTVHMHFVSMGRVWMMGISSSLLDGCHEPFPS